MGENMHALMLDLSTSGVGTWLWEQVETCIPFLASKLLTAATAVAMITNADTTAAALLR